MARATLVLLALLILSAPPAFAEQRKEKAPDLTEGVRIEPRIGNSIPLDGEFVDENGRKVRLRDYFTGEKPVMLTLGYYRCPMLCDLVLNGAVDALKETDWEPGDQYEIVTVSIDPLETPTLAKQKKQNYVKAFGRQSAHRGWHFLTGNQKDITELADAVGFYYRYDEETKEYIHGAALFLVTPDGKLSRCLRGVVFTGQDMRLSLAEASEGKQVSTLDSLLLLCFHFDESRGTYSIQAVRVMQIGGAIVLLALALLLFPVWLRPDAGSPTRPRPRRKADDADPLILAQSGGGFWMPEQGSSTAPTVDFVFAFITWISLFFFSLIVALMIFFIIRYRRRKGYTPEAAPKSHLGVEIVWTAIPFFVVVAIFWVGFKAFLDIATPPENAYEIRVIGQKWRWAFEYPNGWVDDILHVPLDRAVVLTLRSEDVIHSLSIPAFRVKMDVVPGRYNKTWFKATKAGSYDLLCAEYCGTQHSDMLSQVIVHESGGYEKWLKEASNLLSPLLRTQDLTDAGGLITRLRSAGAPVYEFVSAALTDETKTLMAAWDGTSDVSDEPLTAVLTADLNALLKGESIFEEVRFAGVTLSADTKKQMEKEELVGDDLIQLNRFLISDAFPDAMTRGPDLVEVGRYIYERKHGCVSCHTLTGTSNIGPSFKGTWGTERPLKDGGKAQLVDENYVRESILNPQVKIAAGYEPVMPTYKGRLSDREIDSVIAFLKSLEMDK